MHKRLLAAALALVAVVVVVAGLLVWRSSHQGDYERALSWLPGETLRATYTDWSAVRAETDDTTLDAGSSEAEIDGFIDRAYELDLISTSAISASTVALSDRYGFSPVNAEWEMYGQSREGAVVVLKLSEDEDMAGIERNLRTLGYAEPSGGLGSGGVWAGGADLVAKLDQTLTPVQQSVAVLPGQHVVLMGDSARYVGSAVEVITGSAESLISQQGVSDLAQVPETPVSAVLFAADFSCEALSMGAADEEDQRVADRLVADAGEISPLSGLVMALEPDRSMVVGMEFESSDQAERNLEPRVELASGDAVGQGGTFAERFSIESAESSGDLVVLRLEPTDDEQALIGDLTQGPVLFATC